ncbi:MAG: HAMP domain-containing sensor histidine kinase [Paludibacteraceae bacterium]|nr:HAMP domain-containing sensor histidine kinase [Paludibacteraceae bacterium]
MASIYELQGYFKYLFIGVALAIASALLWVSSTLIDRLSKEEDAKMELWAQATRILASADAGEADFKLAQEVVIGNTTIPVMLVGQDGEVISYRNLPNESYSEQELKELAANYARVNESIYIEVREGETQYICYDDSVLFKLLKYYPFVLVAVLVLFFVLILVILYVTKMFEQNKVWVGLSKETAHQLGTPISSLMAWSEILKQQYPDDKMLPEMAKDIDRLRMVADRFSQIGSKAELELTELNKVVERTVLYMRKRISRQISLTYEATGTYYAMLNVPLFEWVIENLCKNAVDAISDEGSIRILITAKESWICVDVTDNGRGIAKHDVSKVFRPGFTTKRRGWGLGLSLAYRIIEEYHRGKIYVRYSEVNVGTTFRIELQKA